jgi:hypothetical protein
VKRTMFGIVTRESSTSGCGVGRCEAPTLVFDRVREATHEVGSGALYVNDYILWRW